MRVSLNLIIAGSMTMLLAPGTAGYAQTRATPPITVTPATPISLPKKKYPRSQPSAETPKIEGTLLGVELTLECQVLMQPKPWPHGPLTGYRTGYLRFRMSGTVNSTTMIDAFPSVPSADPDASQTFVAGKTTESVLRDPSQPLGVSLQPNVQVLSQNFSDLGGGTYKYTGPVPACPQGWVQ